MKYKWDREINVYAIAINRYIEDELLELVPEISNLPPSRQGVSLTRTVPEIDKTVWKLGFDLIFYPNTPDMPTYGWKFRHGKFKKFIYGRNE